MRIAYFGDHFWSDVQAGATFVPQGFTSEQKKWDAIAVIEELWRFDNESSMGKDPLLLDNSAFWGENFFIDNTVPQEEQSSTEAMTSAVKNYFVAELEKVARYALPFVKNMEWLM